MYIFLIIQGMLNLTICVLIKIKMSLKSLFYQFDYSAEPSVSDIHIYTVLKCFRPSIQEH